VRHCHATTAGSYCGQCKIAHTLVDEGRARRMVLVVRKKVCVCVWMWVVEAFGGSDRLRQGERWSSSERQRAFRYIILITLDRFLHLLPFQAEKTLMPLKYISNSDMHVRIIRRNNMCVIQGRQHRKTRQKWFLVLLEQFLMLFCRDAAKQHQKLFQKH
jgi:hypothetical protein